MSIRMTLSACVILLFISTALRAGDELNTLTDAQKAAGWKLLFDGKTLTGWHSFKEKKPGEGWAVKDGVLAFTPKKGPHGGLVTDDEFENFELSIEWKVSVGGNSGVFYRMADEGPDLNWTGIEYQLIDDAKHPDAKVNPNRTTASAYYMYPPTKNTTRPAGEWNVTRIVANGTHIEHWLNSEKVLDYEIGSDDWLKRYNESKFKTHPKYGRLPRGHLALQNHGDAVEFRNIKIRAMEK